MSLLLGNGHSGAARYPLWKLAMEAEIVRDRLNSLAVTQAILTQGAIGSVLSKEGAKAFKELVEQLNGG